MDKQLIINKINDGLANEFEKKDATTFLPDADMRQTLELDSLDMVDLVVLIEEDFGIKVKKRISAASRLSRICTIFWIHASIDNYA